MPYVCRNCDHFEPERVPADGCPMCGGGMRFTMLGQLSVGTAGLGPTATAAWNNPYAGGYEEVEAPWKCRYAQICVGISTYLFVYRWGPRLLTFLAGAPDKLPSEKQAAFAVALLIANCIAAFSGGFAAGFWARNWRLQGLGVIVGVLTIPLGMLYFTTPKNWTMFGVTLAATSILTLVGAFAGHYIVKPTRIPV